MHISNIRLGLATNSSSTHSLIYLPDKAEDVAPLQGCYGWEWFVLASREAKLGYLAQTLFASLEESAGNEVAAAVANAWTGANAYTDGYVDHQSLVDLPLGWEGKSPDKEFFEQLKRYILQDRITILGGNDNEDAPGGFPVGDMKPEQKLRNLRGGRPRTCRKDGDYWTLFNGATGAKLRLSFVNDKPYVKSSAPELVDLKITDMCSAGCCHCMQDSTVDGRHASIKYICDIAYALSSQKVFEVAIGGGEPTSHPDFIRILKMFHDRKIVPNFSTRNLRYFENDSNREAVLKYAGAFAYSAISGYEVWKFIRNLDEYDIPPYRAAVHYVLGLNPIKDLTTAVNECKKAGVRLVLLGFKSIGRGCRIKPYDYSNWLDIVKEAADWVHIDTHLAKGFHDQIKEAGVPDEMYTTEEGKFSMYMDAVERKIARSSYDTDQLPMADIRKSHWLDAYREW